MKKLISSIVELMMSKRAKIPDEYLAEFELDVVTANIKREKILAIILMIIIFFLFFIDLKVYQFWTTNVYIFGRFGYFHYALIIIIIILAITSSGKRIIAENVKLYKTIHLILLLVVISLCAVISAMNSGLPPFIYIISMFSVASLIIFDNYISYIIYIISYVLYTVIVSKSDLAMQSLDAYLLFLAMLMILAIIVSVINVASFKKSFLDRKLILNKNMEMNSLSTLLIRSNAVLRAQLETSLDGIIVIDKNNKILCNNRKINDVLGLTEDIISLRDGIRFYLHMTASVSDELESKKRLVDTILQTDKACCEKIRLKNGTLLDICTVPISYYNEEYGKVWYIRDITEKEKMLEALKVGSELNERLLLETQKYDELKNEFFANISHEFRTPLNIILGTLQLMNHMMTERHDTDINKKINKYVGSMKQNCYRLLRLTNNLIDMTRLDTGFFEMNLQCFNIVQVVEEITLSVADFIESKGIELVFDTDVEEKIISVDGDKIERILLNLLSNAIKFTKQKGVISVNICDKGESIEISVKDTGIGIPEDKHAIIFERFRQVNSSLTRTHEGSGIGLPLTKHLVELHGGSIKVVSEVGKGSDFIIELPCRTIDGEVVKKPSVFSAGSYVESINVEFSDIYSI